VNIIEIGREGENLARVVLQHFDCDIFQADWIVQKDEQWYIAEVKRKERFVPPPFEGHGLDRRQVEARLKFQQETGIRCFLLVFDLTDGNVYWQWLDVLNDGRHFDTKKGIRIYPMESYNKLLSGKALEQIARKS